MRNIVFVDREPQGAFDLEPNRQRYDWVRRCPKCKHTELTDKPHGKLLCAGCKKIIAQFEIYDRKAGKVIAYAGTYSWKVRWLE